MRVLRRISGKKKKSVSRLDRTISANSPDRAELSTTVGCRFDKSILGLFGHVCKMDDG